MGVDTKWLAKHFEEQEARMSDTTVTITSETFEYMADRIEELEAKLAKAVELALEDCPFQEGTVDHDYWWKDYRSTLAELAGGKDE